jgi:cytochrome c biogenesis protein CcmG/thiol:disulfide interchange protein DsbE
MKRLIFIVPILLFLVLAVFLFKSLIAPPPQELPSMLVNEPAPNTPLPALNAQVEGFSPADLRAGHVTVLNFFASWCVPCREEAGVLPIIAQMKGVKLYGIAYKDMPEKTEAFLRETGNPFDRLDIDEPGSAGIEWGITGVPETFVIDGKGTVLLRHAGPLTQGVIADDIVPAIRKARG